jgi:hypothetical protein
MKSAREQVAHAGDEERRQYDVDEEREHRAML